MQAGARARLILYGVKMMDESAVTKFISSGGGSGDGFGGGGGFMPFLLGMMLGNGVNGFRGNNGAAEASSCAAEIAKAQAELDNSILTAASANKDAIQNSILFMSTQGQNQTAQIISAINNVGDQASARSEADLRAQLASLQGEMRSVTQGVSVNQTVNQAQSQSQLQAQFAALNDRICSMHNEQIVTNRNVNFGNQRDSGNASGVQVR